MRALLALNAESDSARLPVRGERADERRVGVLGRLRDLRRHRRGSPLAEVIREWPGRGERLRVAQAHRDGLPVAAGAAARAQPRSEEAGAGERALGRHQVVPRGAPHRRRATTARHPQRVRAGDPEGNRAGQL